MTRIKMGLAAALGLFFLGQLSQAALADPLPPGATPVDRSRLAALYLGQTDLWKNKCKGGIYFGPEFQARAWCASSPDTIGVGRWTIEANGDVCQILTWYYASGGRTLASKSERTCLAHRIDPSDTIWRSWPDSPGWWPVDGQRIVPGYRFHEEVLKAQRRLGL